MVASWWGMSVQRSSLTEPFPLARVRETFADWFESVPRYSQHSPASPPESFGWELAWEEWEEWERRVLVRGHGELAPATAGALAGALAGPAMLAVSSLLAARAQQPLGLAALLGAFASRSVLGGPWEVALGWAVAVVFGTVVGACFGALTRRLRLFAPALLFGIVLSFCAWTVLHVLLLRRFAPALASTLPFSPMVLGAMTFGAVLAFEVPIRTRFRAHPSELMAMTAVRQTSSG